LPNQDLSSASLIIIKAAGAALFVTSMTVWWLFLAEMLAVLDFPFRVPVGDLSGLIKGMSEKEIGHITHMV